MEKNNSNGQLQIELKEDVAQGTYANLAIITHSTSEFILDFVRVLFALQDNVKKYEANWGPIRMPEQAQNNGKTYVPNLSDFKGEA